MPTLLKDYFASLPGLRPGARQATSPTLKRNRPFSNVDLGIPVMSGAAQEANANVRRFLYVLIAAVFALTAMAIALDVSGHPVMPPLLIPLLYVYLFLAGRKNRLIRWTLSLAVLVGGAWLVWTWTPPLALFAFFAFASVVAAERFATQTFHFQTTRPKPRALAKTQLAMWAKRFTPGRGLIGSELYPVSLLLIAAAYAIVVLASFWRPVTITEELWVLGCALAFSGLLLVAFYVLEIVAAMQSGRPVVSPQTMFAAAKRGVRRWLRYNWTARQSIGLYRPPAGNCSLRRTKTLVLGLAAVAATTHLAAGHIDLSTPTVRQRPVEKPLQLFEQTMLDRMSEQDRQQWVERRRAAAEPSVVPEWPLHLRFVPALLCLGTASLLFAYVPPVLLASRLSLTERQDANANAMATPEVWGDLTTAVKEAESKTFPASIYLGSDPKTNAPLIYPTSAFREHAQILGSPNSGKTSRALMSVITQLIRRGDSSVVVIDMKGDDQLLFETARLEAEKAGLRFRWHTLREGASAYAMNPLSQQYMAGRAPSTVADLLTTAMNLQFGAGYGPSFFSSQQTRGLANVLDRVFRKHGRPRSFRELEYIASTEDLGISERERQNLAHVMTVLGFCADLDALNHVPVGPEDASIFRDSIDLSHPFRKPQVLFFSLSLSDGPQLSNMVAAMVLNGLVNSAHLMRPSDRTQTHVVIDEFQRLLSPSLPDMFREARSKDIALIVAHQAVEDLRTRNLDVRHVVGSNCGLRQWFTVADIEEAKRLSESAGTTVGQKLSQSVEDGMVGRVSYGRTETEIPVLPVNDVVRASSTKGHSVVSIRQDKETTDFEGFSQVVHCPYTISKAETDKRESRRWPGHVDGTMPVEVRLSREPQPPPYWQPEITVPVDPPFKKRTSVTIDEGEPSKQDPNAGRDLFNGADDE